MHAGAPPAAPRLARAAPWVVGAALAALAAVHFRFGQDFGVYWRAARRLAAGTTLYPTPYAPGGQLPYWYPPGAAALFLPLAPLPLGLAKASWLALLAALGAAVARAMAAREDGPRAGALALLAFLGLARPLLEEIACAQANLVVLALVLAALSADDRGRGIGAGLLLAAAAGLKLAPAVFAADWLLRRRWRALLGLSLGLAALALVPALFRGPAGAIAEHRAWVGFLAAGSPSVDAQAGNQSVFALLGRAGLPRIAGAAAAAALVIASLAARGPEPRRSLLFLCLGLATPMGWVQNYVYALPAMFLFVSRGRWQRWAAAAFGLASLVPMYDVGGPRLERWALEHSLLAAAMLALFLAAARAPARPAAAPGAAGGS